jgi:phosphate transport system substrate-binding protein
MSKLGSKVRGAHGGSITKLCCLVLSCAIELGCNPREKSTAPDANAVSHITLAGSSALVPLITEAANRYMKDHPAVAIEVSAGNSWRGIEQVRSGQVTIGTSDVFAPPSTADGLIDHRIAVLAFAVMAHRDAATERVESLSQEQVRGIFSGGIRNWSEFGGTELAVTPINRPPNSGSRAVFSSIVLGGDHFAPGIEEQESSSRVQTLLLERAGAISYLALSYRHDALKVFRYQGIESTPENVASGAYPIWSYEHLYTRGAASPPVQAFIDFILSDSFQREALPHFGFIPIGAMKVARGAD